MKALSNQCDMTLHNSNKATEFPLKECIRLAKVVKKIYSSRHPTKYYNPAHYTE
jgi:hypothetical protein